jgi:integrase
LEFGVRLHDLRHAHASWLLAGGAGLKAVMDRLGHSHIQTTQQYLHTLPLADAEALKAFERIRSHRHE